MNALETWSITTECLIVLVMVVAGTAKIWTPGPFRLTLEMIPWLPRWTIRPIAYGLPCTELAVAIALFSPWVTAGLTGALALLAVFSIPVVWAVSSHQRIRCACFGPLSETRFGLSSVLRLIALGGVAAVPLITGHALPLSSLEGGTLFFGFAAAGSLCLAVMLAATSIPAFKSLAIQFAARGSK